VNETKEVMHEGLKVYYHRNDSNLNETELLNVTEVETNMTTIYNGASSLTDAGWYNYTKLYFTDYMVWKITDLDTEKSSLITELAAAATALQEAE